MESKLSIEGARETDHESGNNVNAHQNQNGSSSVPIQTTSSRCDLMLSPSDIPNAIQSSQGAVLDSSDPGCSHLAGSQALLDLGYNVALSTDRMNPSYNGTYATLTPLRPLPPIATVAEKFTRVGGSDSMSYALMLNNNASLGRTSSYEGNMEYSAYKFSKDYELENNAMESTFEEREQAARSELLQNDERDFSHEQNLNNSYSSYNQCSTSPIKSEQARDGLVRDNSTIMSPYESYANNLISVSLSQKNLESVALMQQALLQEVASSLQPLGQTYHTMRDDQHQQHNLLMAASQCHVLLSPIHDQPSSSTDMQDSQQELDEINTREVALKISNELKKYSIPQAVFAQRVLGRSQGTLSDLLRNPKPWSKLKSGRETFRRMWNWMKEPEYQRMSQLRMSAAAAGAGQGGVMMEQSPLPSSQEVATSCQPSNSPTMNSNTNKRSRDSNQSDGQSLTKKPRMVFTEIQRRTLVAIFKEIKRPSKEIQATIAEQLGLKVSTVVNFFMNARRRSIDKYLDDTSSKDAGSNSVVSSTANSGLDNMHQM